MTFWFRCVALLNQNSKAVGVCTHSRPISNRALFRRWGKAHVRVNEPHLAEYVERCEHQRAVARRRHAAEHLGVVACELRRAARRRAALAAACGPRLHASAKVICTQQR